MRDRFSPDWPVIELFLDGIVDILDRDEHLLAEAFLSVADPRLRANSAADVKRHLKGIAISPGIPWVLYDTVSALSQKLPMPMRKAIAGLEGMQNGYPKEYLRIADDGRWQIGWKVGDSEWIALDWYVSQERDTAPVVPASVIDFVGGSVVLYSAGLTLPAAANLLVALESVLWDRLSAQGYPRTTERVVYLDVLWKYKVVADRLVVFVGGADKALSDFEVSLASKEGDFSLRKSHEEGDRVVLRADVDPSLVQYLATETASSKETIPEKGLAEALQRARKIGILETLPVQLDELLFRLRNGLLHLPFDGAIDPPVPNPAGGTISKLEDLRTDVQFIRNLIIIIVGLINTIYAEVSSPT